VIDNSRHSGSREPQIQTCTLQGLPDVLRRFGVDIPSFFERFDLSEEVLAIRNHYIPYHHYAEVLHKAAEACDTPHIGLLLTRSESHLLFSEGILGLLLKYCQNFGEVVEAIIRFNHAVSGGATYHLRRAGRAVFFTRRAPSTGFRHDRILQDTSLCDFAYVFQQALGTDWRPQRIHFTYDRPEDVAPYTRLLDCPIAFNSGHQSIALSSRDLARPLKVSDVILEQLLREHTQRTQRELALSYTAATTQLVDVLLPTGLCCANSVAAAFDMHARTLHRRLREEEKTFGALLTERRKVHACAYLRNTTMSIRDISAALGYAAPEAFVRAFRIWFGNTPAAWRLGNL
jgi:AraC-like DNA-binding protein